MARAQRAPRESGAGTDLLQYFLRDIGDERFAVLTREEEARVAAQARAGDGGAVEELVRRNVRFVVATAREEWRRDPGTPMMDLVNSGCLGLCRAAGMFNPEFGNRFVTFALHYVREEMWRVRREGGSVLRMSRLHRSALKTLQGTRDRLRQQLGREPTVRETAEVLGPERVRERLGRAPTAEEVRAGVDEAETWVSEWLGADVVVRSLDEPIDDDGSAMLADAVAEAPGPSGEEQQRRWQELLAYLARAAKEALPRQRERWTFCLWAGVFHRGEGITLEEIASVLLPSVTRERIRQIREKALASMLEWCQAHPEWEDLAELPWVAAHAQEAAREAAGREAGTPAGAVQEAARATSPAARVAAGVAEGGAAAGAVTVDPVALYREERARRAEREEARRLEAAARAAAADAEAGAATGEGADAGLCGDARGAARPGEATEAARHTGHRVEPAFRRVAAGPEWRRRDGRWSPTREAYVAEVVRATMDGLGEVPREIVASALLEGALEGHGEEGREGTREGTREARSEATLQATSRERGVREGGGATESGGTARGAVVGEVARARAPARDADGAAERGPGPRPARRVGRFARGGGVMPALAHGTGAAAGATDDRPLELVRGVREDGRHGPADVASFGSGGVEFRTLGRTGGGLTGGLTGGPVPGVARVATA